MKTLAPIVKSASLSHRLGCLVYDAIAVTAIVFFACFIPVLLSGHAIESGNTFFLIYIVTIIFSYFALCWKKGKTLGMQAWKLEIRKFNDESLRISDSLLRFFSTGSSLLLVGIGYLSALRRPDKLTWHDRASSSYIRKC